MNHGVVSPVQIERICDERLGLFPDLLGFLSDEPLFAPPRSDVAFLGTEHWVWNGNALLTSEGEGFLSSRPHELALYVGELLVLHLPEPRLAWRTARITVVSDWESEVAADTGVRVEKFVEEAFAAVPREPEHMGLNPRVE